VKRPQVIDDLYRDLRDRKLLPVVGLLIVAIIAVPIALGASSEPSSSSESPAAEIVPANAPEAQAAVLADNPGLRNYRERLEQLKAKNPFKQQFQFSDLDEATVEGTTGDTGTATATGGTSGASVTDTGTSTGITDTGTGTGAVGTSDSGTAGVDGTADTSEPEPKFYTWRLDIRYGVDGDIQEQKNVKVLDLLSPIGVFLGASFDAKKASFFLSGDVISSSGDGQCQPAGAACEFLVLKEGQTQYFSYQPPLTEGPVTYVLELKDIKVVKLNNSVDLGG